MNRTIGAMVGTLIFVGLFFAFRLLGPNTTFNEPTKYLYIYSDSTEKSLVLAKFANRSLIKNQKTFDWIANAMGYWKKVKPGRYKIEKGSSILEIMRLLMKGRQEPLDFTFNKIRLKEDLARLIGRNFEVDSLTVIQYLNNEDTLRNMGLDSNTLLTAFIPNTYNFFWTASVDRIIKRLAEESDKFWNEERIAKAKQLGFTPKEIVIIASIIEEETNQHDEKGLMASVYINRVRKKMKLGADPTVKYALKDFGLKRILKKHTEFKSPYNTYVNLGLPPGPINTPSIRTIEEVLNAPDTEFLYFVAKSDFSGYHEFSENYKQHMQYARMYHKALDSLMKAKAEKN